MIVDWWLLIVGCVKLFLFLFGLVLHHTNTVKVIWWLSSFTGGEDLCRCPSMQYFRHGQELLRTTNVQQKKRYIKQKKLNRRKRFQLYWWRKTCEDVLHVIFQAWPGTWVKPPTFNQNEKKRYIKQRLNNEWRT